MNALLLPMRGLPELIDADGDVVDIAIAHLATAAVRLEPMGEGVLLVTTAEPRRVANELASALADRRILGPALVIARHGRSLPATLFDRLAALGAFTLERELARP